MTLTEWLAFAAIWTLLSLPLGLNAVNCMTAAVANGTRRTLWTVADIALAGGSLARVLTTIARQRLFNRAAGGFYLFTAGLLAVSDARRS